MGAEFPRSSTSIPGNGRLVIPCTQGYMYASTVNVQRTDGFGWVVVAFG